MRDGREDEDCRHLSHNGPRREPRADRDTAPRPHHDHRRAGGAGRNEGNTPTETALAALIGCTNVIGHKNAKRLGVDLGVVTIDANCKFDRRGVLMEEEIETPFPEITLTVHCTGQASQSELDAVGVETAKYCAIAKLFQAAGTKREVNWQKA